MDSDLRIIILAGISTLPALITSIAGLAWVLIRVNSVHDIVNHQRDQMLEKIAKLEDLIVHQDKELFLSKAGEVSKVGEVLKASPLKDAP